MERQISLPYFGSSLSLVCSKCQTNGDMVCSEERVSGSTGRVFGGGAASTRAAYSGADDTT